ncbi:ThiF family adenylyltransferase [Streptomyces griseiscabiei]|uniref:ThiF family adenylyltransferase n=2 Tax=Streptomyces griseiscabiei TaxID=2993540 RepID=A0ABU4LCL8_9ACTN|nr:ThiF family adenylyltransferase [Streptomyces griseiscabiei]MBZ3900164.1 ThiF family adenylyltransferase [Streptomyces griseiscabiei]MDX2913171.1 ThiF family adenylyltransferase [Streptomyces griseiscabiei]
MGADTHRADIEAAAAGAEAVSRNADILGEREQAAVRAATVLIAGCGGGGGVVEPLTRLGVLRFRLADPDRFDVSNLNRQACVRADVGRSKPEAIADRVRALNPSADVTVYAQGLTLENLDEALDGAHIVFDGIDPTMSAWVKYQLHERAARRGIPVLAGMDFGGKPTLYVFDYRRNPVPFYGRASAEAHRENRLWESMRWTGSTHVPSDFLPVQANRFTHGGTWPQIGYCVLGLATLTTRTVVDVLMNRRTRHVVTMDVHAAVMSRPAALIHRARMPVELVRTRRALRAAARRGPRPEPVSPQLPRPLPERLATVLGGARLAPSAYNAQPWRFEILDDRTVRLAPDPERWPAADRDPLGWAESLGCALGSMTYLAHGEWEPRPDRRDEARDSVGRFHCDRLSDDVLPRQGAVGLRATHREDLLRSPLDQATAKRIELLCGERNLTLDVVSGPAALTRLARTRLDASLADDQVRDARLRAWLRARARGEKGRSSFGDAKDLLGRSGTTGALAHALTGEVLPRALARPLGAAAARAEARRLRNCGAVLVLRGPRRTVADRVDAGAALMHIWLTLTEAGYAAQPLGGEFGREVAGLDPDGDDEILAVLRAGRATATPLHRVTRCPVEASVRWDT